MEALASELLLAGESQLLCLESEVARWTSSFGYQTLENGAVAMHVRGASPKSHTEAGDATLGTPVMRSCADTTAGVFGIALSLTVPGDCFGDVYLGLTDADATFNSMEGGKAWGVKVRTGELCISPSAHLPGYQARRLSASVGPRRGVPSCECVLIVDMSAQRLAISINGAPPLNTGFKLSSAVRPSTSRHHETSPSSPPPPPIRSRRPTPI